MKLSPEALPIAIPARVCALFPGALGDFICFLPELRRLVQNSRLDLFARSEYADLVPAAIKVRSSECPEIAKLFVEGGGEERGLRQFFSPYQIIYSWMGSGLAVFVRELRRVAGDRARIFPFRPIDGSQHQIDHYLSCMGGDAHARTAADIPLVPQALTWCDEFARLHQLSGKPVLVVAPGSGAPEKNWPVGSFRQVAHWWQREKQGKVLTLIGPVEEERGGVEALENETLVLRRLTLAQTAAVLSRCQLYLGNDSGTTHLAAAVGAPTVALFGPSDIVQWAPRGKSVTVISLNVECSPCTNSSMKSCWHRKCLATLTADTVISRLEHLTPLGTLTRWGVGIRV